MSEDKIKQILKKVGRNIKETTVALGAAGKQVVVETNKKIHDSIEAKRESERNRIKEQIIEYKKIVKNATKKIKNDDAKDFINLLGESPTALHSDIVNKIKKSFPIPTEQTVIWSYFVIQGSRTGGIAVTNKGIFLKTLVTALEEKKIRKDERKVSRLIYLTWDMINFSDFTDGYFYELINEFGKDNVSNFILACNNIVCSIEQYKMSSANYYSGHSSNIMDGAIIASSGSILSSAINFTRNNGAGNNTGAGFGFFAEQANNMADILNFKNAKVVGGDNVKNGPDRLVNGVYYQTKYYKTPRRTVGATFDNKNTGNYRYWNADGTPMKLEVPKGQGAQARKAFQQKIINGKVRTTIDGKEYIVTDPNKANEIVVEGHYSYEQSVKMARAGTIESLKYDLKTGSVTALSMFGISFIIDFCLCYRKTKDKKESFISAMEAGGRVGALTLANHVLISQLSRTKTVSTIMTKNLIGAQIGFSLAGFVIFSIPDTYNLIAKRISAAQYAKNLAVLSASIVGGTAGAVAGKAVAKNVGGFIGGAVAGTAAAVAVSNVADIFYEGDDKRMARLFNAITCLMSAEYLLDKDEFKKFEEKMNKTSDRKIQSLFKKVMASNNQEETIREFLKEYFDEVVNEREIINFDLIQIS